MTALASIAHGKRIHLRGTVQGVGFRPWVYRLARRFGVTGSVRNDSSGVTIEAFGDDEALHDLLTALATPPHPAHIEAVDATDIPLALAPTFEIESSEQGLDRQVSIPPDLATCDDCAAEIADPSNRRFRYPFTNCTRCGPRFTIANDVPYDRAATTMVRFAMCATCRAEYDNPDDRRFHAQPNACPVCGPRLMLYADDGSRLHADDPIGVAARALADGLIVAVKGIGGIHLACDAASETAVRRLRERKRRDEKPFAVMVRTIAAARSLGVVGPIERELLTSVERPIVLLRKRRRAAIAPSVAPNNRLVGVFLPYSPLHHLLLAAANRPLVMTSGNLSDEPIAADNDEAIERLRGIADLLVLHDRAIENRCDDSVVAVIDGRGAVLRRSRGYVPRAIEVARGFARPVLACGALLKNTFCLAEGSRAWLGPHICDLENLETYGSYVSSIDRLEQFLRIQPEVIAHDLHPDYLSTTYARHRGGHLVPVQHHHAHVVSAMAEHGLDGPAIGIAYDGTGYGTDGTMWGGEILVATAASFRRVGTFRPLALVGGDRAIREPWRLALALVHDAFGGGIPLSVRDLFDETGGDDWDLVCTLLGGPLSWPRARGVGRYFDAFGALFLGRRVASFEGQIALEWNQAAAARPRRRYAFEIATDEACAEIDLRATVREAVRDRAHGESVATIAAIFHNTIAEATAAVVKRAVDLIGPLPIVASGGCFQNARLAERVRAALAPDHIVRFHQRVPPGDGGLALGQAIVADAIARG